ncbi:MAG: hypothetical protein HY886_01285 [Deltaproteobacteria bacterium]|nr:hypothetical protein [Deltaproteobacteria bacterium]
MKDKKIPANINLATRMGAGGKAAKTAAPILLALSLLFTWGNIDAYRTNGASITRLNAHLNLLEKKTAKQDHAALKPVDPKMLAKDIEFINELILRKTLSWTGLLTDLEAGVPRNVQILRISPVFEKSSVAVGGRAKKMSDVLAMVETMERAKRFKDVFLLKHSEDKGGMVLFTVSAGYSMKEGQ